MPAYNRVILLGNMTRAIEVKVGASGKSYGNFGIAVNKGEKKVNFFDVTVFDKTAENMQQYTDKGSLVLVDGELDYGAWEDRDTGQKRSKVTVTGHSVQFISRSASSEPNSEPRPQPSDYTTDPATADDDDSIPF